MMTANSLVYDVENSLEQICEIAAHVLMIGTINYRSQLLLFDF